MNIKKFLLPFLLIIISVVAKSQKTDTSKLKVFIDCRTGCDFNYIKSEINIVDFVINRTVADEHVLITALGNGTGAVQYKIELYGQNRFAGYKDTVVFFVKPNTTPSERRDIMLQNLMVGLTPLIAKTVYASNIKLSMKATGAPGRPAFESDNHDKWDFWVYRIAARGDLSADRVYKNNTLSSNFSANRTTDKLKIEFNANWSLRNTVYTYETATDTSKYVVKNNDYGLYHNIVRAFSPHWSYGYQASFTNSTFSNIKERIYVNPAIEYNVFDYKEVNNRFFVVRYGLDVNYSHYFDTTIYNKIQETLYGHRFSAAITLNKKWGTFNSGAYYRNFFHDWKLRSMGINANADVRVTGGLSFFVNVNGSVVKNQISLVKGGATEQEVLTRKRQLASNYNYSTSFGLAFRFGSIVNNFVNPRFDGYGGF